MIRQEFIVLLL